MLGPFREWFYLGNLLKPVHLPACVVSVGNISLGGTGKSPFVMLMCEWASNRGIKTALLTRGYKRKHTKLEIVGPNASLPEVERLGDEPWMIKARVPGISMLVHADRARMAKRHWEDLGSPSLVVLDDAFQHWRVSRDRDVIMLDAKESLHQGTFPFGRLRESAKALARADLVVITRANSVSPEELSRLELEVRDLASNVMPRPWKRAQSPRLRIACADYKFIEFFSLADGKRCEAPSEKSLLLVSGVAKPDGVRALVRELELPVAEEIHYPDHHRLSEGDLRSIANSLKAKGECSALLLTEKDWARWRTNLAGIKGYGMRVGFEFLGGSGEMVEEFFSEVEKCITSL